MIFLVIFSDWTWKHLKSMYWILLECCMVIPKEAGGINLVVNSKQFNQELNRLPLSMFFYTSSSVSSLSVSGQSQVIPFHQKPTMQCGDWILELQNCMYWILLECCMVIPHRGGRGHQPPCQPPCNQSYWVRVLDPILRWLWGSMRLMSPVSLTGMIFLWSSMIGSENWTRAYIESCWSAAWSSPTEEAGGINLVVNSKQEQGNRFESWFRLWLINEFDIPASLLGYDLFVVFLWSFCAL